MKGMTERDRDLGSMALIARTGLDHDLILNECIVPKENNVNKDFINYDLILNECIEQYENDARSNIWESSLYEKCIELKDKYAVNVPIIHRLREISEELF